MWTTAAAADDAATIGRTLLDNIHLALVYGLLTLVTISANLAVILSFALNEDLRSARNCFLLGMALSDLAIALLSMPVSSVSAVLGYWPFGRRMCDCWLAFDYVAGSASVYNMLLATLVRYMRIKSPLKCRPLRTRREALLSIVALWIISCILWPTSIFLSPYFENHRIMPETQCYILLIQTNVYFTVITSIISFYIPLMIMCYLNHGIYREMKKSEQLRNRNSLVYISAFKINTTTTSTPSLSCISIHQIQSSSPINKSPSKDTLQDLFPTALKSPSKGNVWAPDSAVKKNNRPENDEDPRYSGLSLSPASFPKELSLSLNNFRPLRTIRESCESPLRPMKTGKAAIMLTSILLTFVITWMPYNVMVLLRHVFDDERFTQGWWWNVSYNLCYVNSTFNTIWYALCNPLIRHTFKRILKCQWNARSCQPPDRFQKRLNI